MMPSQLELDKVYMTQALNFATLSKSKRKVVGAVLVTQKGVVLPGVNGSAKGTSNDLEFEDEAGNLVTKPTTIHAELNCILKAAKEGVSVEGSTLYVTLSPCEACAAMLIQAAVKEVVYLEDYRCSKGLTLLQDFGIFVRQFKL